MYSRPTLPALPEFSTPFHRERYYDSVNLMVPIARAPVMRLQGLGAIAGLGEAVRCFGARAVPPTHAARIQAEQALTSVRAAIAAERANPGSTPTSWLRGVLASFAAAFEPGSGQWCQQPREAVDAETALLSILRQRPSPGAPDPSEVPLVGSGAGPRAASSSGTPSMTILGVSLGTAIVIAAGVAGAVWWWRRSKRGGRLKNRKRNGGRLQRAERAGYRMGRAGKAPWAAKAKLPSNEQAAFMRGYERGEMALTESYGDFDIVHASPRGVGIRPGPRKRNAGLSESKKPVWQQIPSHLSRWRKTSDGYIWHGRGRAQGLRIAIERMGSAEDERWGWAAYVTAPGVSAVFGPLTSPEAAVNRARDFVLRRIG